MYYSTECRAGSRCHDYRQCPECAKIRQAKIATLAESGSQDDNELLYAVIKSSEQHSFTNDKTAFLKKLRRVSNGGIWTIEKAHISTGLHLNVVLGSDKELQVERIQKMWVDSEVWIDRVERRNIRNVAAYIAKQNQQPAKDEYSGHLFGSFGTWKRPLAAIVEGNSQIVHPIIKGHAIEGMMEAVGIPEPEPELFIGHKWNPYPVTFDDQYDKEIPFGNLEKVGGHKERLKRLYAAHEKLINVDGYAYVNGYGLITREELEKAGIFGVVD